MKTPQPDIPIEIFTTQDLGEQAFVRSLLESHEIRTLEPNFNAERMSIWTNPFFRSFSVYVHPKDVLDARELVNEHSAKPLENPRPEA